MRITKTSADKIKKYRTEYLNSLPEFQELFLELMINKSDCYLLQTEDNEIGYAIINTNNILIEFYVTNKYKSGSDEYFSQIIKDLKITEIYCKSFDSPLLSNCHLNSFSNSVIGKLYRDYAKPLVIRDMEIIMVKADLLSVKLLLRQDDSIKELFETEEQLAGFIQNENVFQFYKNDEFIGCGMILRTHQDWDFCDLGVWVNPEKRGRSFGAQILLNLREFAIRNNMKPSCGCAIENLASQKIIEKSGFVSRYNLLSFKPK